MLHITLHFLVPAVLVALFWRQHWWQNYLWLLAGLAIDIDHLLATPIYDPLRCSIGFHPLHTWPAALVYTGLLFHKRTRVLACGLLLHLLLDASDCLTMPGGLPQLLRFFGSAG
jgi:hypothetical protein